MPLIDDIFAPSAELETSSIIYATALEDSHDGLVLVRFGDDIEDEEPEGVVFYDPFSGDDELNLVGEDEAAEVLGEDDEPGQETDYDETIIEDDSLTEDEVM